MAAAANQRVDEMKAQLVKREKGVEQLQEQVRQLSHSLDKANKVCSHCRSMPLDTQYDKMPSHQAQAPLTYMYRRIRPKF